MKKRKPDFIVKEFGARVRLALGVQLVSIYWFGSRARGEGSEDSDYDLLLETKKRMTEHERDKVADVAIDLSAEWGVLLDIHTRTTEVMARDAELSPLIATVLKEAVAA